MWKLLADVKFEDDLCFKYSESLLHKLDNGDPRYLVLIVQALCYIQNKELMITSRGITKGHLQREFCTRLSQQPSANDPQHISPLFMSSYFFVPWLSNKCKCLL